MEEVCREVSLIHFFFFNFFLFMVREIPTLGSRNTIVSPVFSVNILNVRLQRFCKESLLCLSGVAHHPGCHGQLFRGSLNRVINMSLCLCLGKVN